MEINNEQDDCNSLIARARSLFLRLPIQKDKLRAAMWIAKLNESTDTELKTSYVKLLVDILQRNVLLRPFTEDPPETLEPLTKEYSLDDVIDILLQEKERDKGSGDRPPVFTEVSSDLKQYAAAQIIPKFGVHCYFAVSDEPLSKWRQPCDSSSQQDGQKSELKKSLCGLDKPDQKECHPCEFDSTSGDDEQDFQNMSFGSETFQEQLREHSTPKKNVIQISQTLRTDTYSIQDAPLFTELFGPPDSSPCTSQEESMFEIVKRLKTQKSLEPTMPSTPLSTPRRRPIWSSSLYSKQDEEAASLAARRCPGEERFDFSGRQNGGCPARRIMFEETDSSSIPPRGCRGPRCHRGLH